MIGASLVCSFALARAAPPDAQDMSGRRELQMMQCPSTAPGAVTRLRDVARGVELDVRAQTAWQKAEVRRRAQKQASLGRSRVRGTIEHTGEGTGSGRYGYCPGVLDGATWVAKDTNEGVRVTVTAADPRVTAELRKSARARLDRLQRERSSAKR